MQGCPPISQRNIIKRGEQFKKLTEKVETLETDLLHKNDQIKALEERIKELEANQK